MRPEHEAAVRLACGQQNVPFKDEVAVGLLSHDEKLLLAREMDFTIHNVDLAPVIRVLPASKRLAVKERHKVTSKGRNRDG